MELVNTGQRLTKLKPQKKNVKLLPFWPKCTSILLSDGFGFPAPASRAQLCSQPHLQRERCLVHRYTVMTLASVLGNSSYQEDLRSSPEDHEVLHALLLPLPTATISLCLNSSLDFQENLSIYLTLGVPRGFM